MQRPTFSVRARFVLVLLVVVLSFVLLAWKGTAGLASQRQLTETLFNDIIATQHESAEMVGAMDSVHAAAVSALATRDTDRQRSQALTTKLSNELIPAADAELAAVQQLHAPDEPEELQTIANFARQWHLVRALWNSMALNPPDPTIGIAKIDDAFGRLNQVSRALVLRESKDGQAEFVDSTQPYRTQRTVLLVVLSAALLATLAALGWLYRGVLPRAWRYSEFAKKIANGAVGGHLETRGTDELAILGRTLDEMATRRQRERNYDVSQLQFAETMQLSENEPEAHRMLKRHLERSIGASDVVILNRNNSQDRLEAVTDLPPDSPLVASLVGATPRACVAIRQARTHERAAGEDVLLQCSVCAECPGRSTCTPFLVGGEVIGSVLLTRPEALEEDQSRRIRDSVVQAAPVLANLRNLAIAETRAATDSLTGLPNRRSVDANLMRMVAHAGRSMESIAVLLLDLDHFKNLNDRFGHAGGDEALAAVGAALRATVRESDFAGRYGGEEFIVVLPNTSLEGAVNVAELLRRAIGDVAVASVDQAITVSIGVAVLPDHAADWTGLVRSADRALYLAKNNGRDRVESAAWTTMPTTTPNGAARPGRRGRDASRRRCERLRAGQGGAHVTSSRRSTATGRGGYTRRASHRRARAGRRGHRARSSLPRRRARDQRGSPAVRRARRPRYAASQPGRAGVLRPDPSRLRAGRQVAHLRDRSHDPSAAHGHVRHHPRAFVRALPAQSGAPPANGCRAPEISSGIETRSCGTSCPNPNRNCSWPR